MAKRVKGKAKRTANKDASKIVKESRELKSQVRRDMFNPARMTSRHIDENLKNLDRQLESLERIRTSKSQTSQMKKEIRLHKEEMRAQRKLLKQAKKEKKQGATRKEIIGNIRAKLSRKSTKVKALPSR